MSATIDGLDVSLRDFEPPPSPESLRHSMGPSEPATTEVDEDEDPEEGPPDSETGSAGGYSPPAWRRLGNGDRSSGFWRGPANGLGVLPVPFRPSSRAMSPIDDEEYEGDDDGILERAIRTRLPKGSQSPERTRHSTPERVVEDETLRVQQRSPSSEAGSPEPLTENCEFSPHLPVRTFQY